MVMVVYVCWVSFIVCDIRMGWYLLADLRWSLMIMKYSERSIILLLSPNEVYVQMRAICSYPIYCQRSSFMWSVDGIAALMTSLLL
jgi:hypothetical protein